MQPVALATASAESCTSDGLCSAAVAGGGWTFITATQELLSVLLALPFLDVHVNASEPHDASDLLWWARSHANAESLDLLVCVIWELQGFCQQAALMTARAPPGAGMLVTAALLQARSHTDANTLNPCSCAQCPCGAPAAHLLLAHSSKNQ